MAYQFITYRVADRIAYVTINRPEVMNALHAEASAEMRDAFERFRSDDEAWVAIVTGAGDRAFSAGNDLRATAERAADRSAARPGFELALACDVIVAADSARFGLPEPRVGLVAGAGGMHRLPRHVPLKIAMGMMLTGRQIGAQEAAELGIVNEVVPLGDLMAAAERWAADMLACSPVSLRITKQCVLAGLASPVEVAMEADRTSGRLSVLRNSEDAREGPLAFAQKRPPQWRGL
jgi:enoyl-CoA hydratase/carnithine racemase